MIYMKLTLIICATLFGIAGAYIPYLWGDTDLLGGWSILTSTLGGIFGVVVGYWIAKRWIV